VFWMPKTDHSRVAISVNAAEDQTLGCGRMLCFSAIAPRRYPSDRTQPLRTTFWPYGGTDVERRLWQMLGQTLA